MTSAAVVAHEQSGRRFSAAGVDSFVLEAGSGDPVVCLHGVPTSSYLYRKVVPELAARGLRGVAFDLPGLGLADRPVDFDYTWSGLGSWATAAVDALGLDRFHLVVHDIGGPVGFELAAAVPERIASLTVLNTMVEVAGFRRPWVMEPFAHKYVGRAYLALLNKPLFRLLMRLQGVANMEAVTPAELGAYVDLLRRGDRGAAFLRIMRGFERTDAKQERYLSVLGSDRYPVQVVWAVDDPGLPIATFGEVARRAAGQETIVRLPGKHFFPEDQAPAIAAQVAELAARA